jgi:hypothetical protein
MFLLADVIIIVETLLSRGTMPPPHDDDTVFDVVFVRS